MYKDPERLPKGLEDVVAYWAEHRIFGGVVLFDRGQSKTEARPRPFCAPIKCVDADETVCVQCNGVYLQRASLSATLAPPTEEQFSKLMHYLLDPGETGAEEPLPILITTDNKWRWHEVTGMAD